MTSESRRIAVAFTTLACALLGACSEGSSSAPDPSAELEAIGEDIQAFALEREFALRFREGLPVERLPQVGYAEAERVASFQAEVLRRARAVDARGLGDAEALTLQSVIWDAEMAVEGLQYFWHESVLTPYASPLARPINLLFASLPLSNEEDLSHYITLARQIPDFVRDIQEVVEGQMERGIVLSRQNMPAATGLVRARMAPAAESPFWVGDSRLQGFDGDRVAAFRSELAAVLEEEVNPALGELLSYLEGPYSAAAPEGVGVSQYPNGPEYYRYLTRFNTTMDVTPEEVQRVGYALLDEFDARMAEIREKLGWTGTREEFHRLLRTDARYFPKSPDEVAERLMAAADAMWAVADQFFVVMPRAPYGVRRLAPELEASLTYGYYQVPTGSEIGGYYMYNGSRLDQRTRLNHTAIALHELVPGHHFQLARQRENEALPAFRKNVMYTAYVEGWGSYASFLGLEAGLLDDPLDHYGMYILESFLASRLVVDPGMNYFGMTRDEARQFMLERTLESEAQIATETLRYSTDTPGQALGYQMGKWKFTELRRRAESALGDRFDIRLFHEELLGNGSHPMTVIEDRIGHWIEEQGAPGG